MIYAVAIVALVVGCLTGFLSSWMLVNKRLKAAGKTAQKIIAEAQAKSNEILLTAKEEAGQLKARSEAALREKQEYLQQGERRLRGWEESLDKRQKRLEEKENQLVTREKEIAQKLHQIEELAEEQRNQLQEVLGLSREEAERRLFQKIEQEVKEKLAVRVRQWETEVKAQAELRVRKSLAEVIQRYVAEVVSEVTTTVVPLPSDEIKGRLIGREGRNIRALEQATGVELIIDDTPEVVVLSSFDPLRREVARIALERLIRDGRIQPARVEEEVERAKAKAEEEVRHRGEEAALKAGIGDLHPELIKLLGQLHFRTSYGQNMLTHSLEVSYFASLLATEVGADVAVAKKAGLLHDIGKAVGAEGPHALIGSQLVKQWDGSPKVAAAVAEHHGETEFTTIEGYLVAAADAISGARPGARREELEAYIKRLQDLEKIALSFPGVEKAFAIQAGREVRVMVKPEQVDDLSLIRLCHDIVQKIKENLQFPGEIKVTVIRETRAVDYAR